MIFQDTLQCCGIHGPDTYTSNKDWLEKHNNVTVPASCCGVDPEDAALTCKTSDNNLYTDVSFYFHFHFHFILF